MTDTADTNDSVTEAIPIRRAATRAKTPMEMLERAITSGMAPEIIRQLMDLQERHERNANKREFDAAIADAKAELPVILKTQRVDFTSAKGRTNYQYEDLASIAAAIDPILSKHGLSYRFRTNVTPDTKTVLVTCVLSHRAGYSEENTLPGPYDESGSKNALQAMGSAVTYLSRYTLKAALGLAAAKDDDARSFSQDTDTGSETLSLDQVAELESMIINTGADRTKFLALLKVKDLREMAATEHDKLKEMLRVAQQRRLAMAAQSQPTPPEVKEAVPS